MDWRNHPIRSCFEKKSPNYVMFWRNHPNRSWIKEIIQLIMSCFNKKITHLIISFIAVMAVSLFGTILSRRTARLMFSISRQIQKMDWKITRHIWPWTKRHKPLKNLTSWPNYEFIEMSERKRGTENKTLYDPHAAFITFWHINDNVN